MHRYVVELSQLPTSFSSIMVLICAIKRDRVAFVGVCCLSDERLFIQVSDFDSGRKRTALNLLDARDRSIAVP